MGKATQAIMAVIIIALGLFGAFLTVGVQQQSAGRGDANAWLLAAWLMLALTVLVAFFYFALHPAIVWADLWRARALSGLRSARATIPNPPKFASPGGGPSSGLVGPLTLTSADYGANNTRIDVRAVLASRIKEGRLETLVASDLVGYDPVQNVVKELRVTYNVGQQGPFSVTVPEGQNLSIP